MIKYENILFCTDFSEDANIAFLHALDLAKKYNAKLHLIHVPHSSYAYCRHIVDEHVPEGAAGGEAFFTVLVRLSLGIEDQKDLIADLSQALAALLV